ncbi:uncharacterized protein [Typha latifolia]|uniref:uncharacterized protein n=1 Tax=Typha latifolia TaxID=4733 RepID=UPI003C2C727A
MVDTNTVCAMCGDIGFPEKLFQCIRCHYRFQHSYCTNYYGDERSDTTAGVCDWCLSEERSGGKQHGGQTKKSANKEISGDKSKQSSDREESGSRGKSGGASSSSKASSRRYKLLKDVLC